MLINETERLMRQRALELAVQACAGGSEFDVVATAGKFYDFLSGAAVAKVKRGPKPKVAKVVAPVTGRKKKRVYTKRAAYWQTVGKKD